MKESYIDLNELQELRGDLEGLYEIISGIKHQTLETRIKSTNKALSMLDCILFKVKEIESEKENGKK